MKWRNSGRVMNAPQAMTPPAAAEPSATVRVVRRLAISAIMSALVFAVLWLWALNVMTSVLMASTFGVVIIAVSSFSDLAETGLDAIASVVLGIFAAIGAVFGGILSLFVD